MAKELIVNVTKDNTRIVLLKKGEIFEYHEEEKNKDYNVGDIYLASVKEIVPGLNASFVDIGYNKDAFLGYSDLGLYADSQQTFVKKVSKQKKHLSLKECTLSPPLDRNSKIEDVLKKKSKLLVRVIKEPIATKPIRVSSIISIAGRYLVLIPFGNEIRFSKKIRSLKEKKRLGTIIESIKCNNFTIVVRKEAEEKDVATLNSDLQRLITKWEEGVNTLKNAKIGEKIIGELKRAPSILRDALSEKFDKIIVDDPELYEELKEYVKSINPEKEKIVSLYTKKTPIFEHFDIEKHLKRLLGKVINLKGGGHIVIEQTEALCAIDVNSGKRISTSTDQEQTALQVNKAAIKEVFRQGSLKGIGGIMIIDLISMKNPTYKKEIYELAKTYAKESRAKINVLQINSLGLLPISRERVRPPIQNTLAENQKCTMCNGTGEAITNTDALDEIEYQIKALLADDRSVKNITLTLHPYLYSHFNEGIWSIRRKWQWKYGITLKLKVNSDLPITAYQLNFVDKKGKENIIEP